MHFEDIAIFRVHYKVSHNLTRTNGVFVPYQEKAGMGFDGEQRYRDSRPFLYNRSNCLKYASRAAQDKAAAILLEVGREWAKANPDKLTAGERSRLQEEIGHVDSAIAELEAKLAAAKKERAGYAAALAALEGKRQ